MPSCAFVTPRNGGKQCRTVNCRPNTIPTTKQRALRSDFTRAVRAWSGLVDPVSQAIWIDSPRVGTNRAGNPYPANYWLHWLNSTITRYYISPPPLLIFQPPRYFYIITHMGIIDLDIANQQIQTTITYYRDRAWPLLTSVGIFQVHPAYAGDPLAYKYTHGIGNKDLGPWFPVDEPTTETDWWHAHWEFASGDTVQIFARATWTWDQSPPIAQWYAGVNNQVYGDLISVAS